MFNKLEKTFYDGRLVKGTHQIVSESSEKHHQVGIEYADDQLPSNEVMHIEEFEQMKNDNQEKSKNRADKFQDATDGVQARILNELEMFNPRWHETMNILQRVGDRINQIKNEFINHVYGLTDFLTLLNVKHIKDKIKELGGEASVGGLSPFEVDFIELCEKHEVTLDALNRMTFVKTVIGRLNSWQENVLELYIGAPLTNWRNDDVVKVLEPVYAAKVEALKEEKLDEDNMKETIDEDISKE